MKVMPSRRLLLSATLATIGLCCAMTAAAQTGRPEEILAQRYQLERLPASNVWVLPLEAEVRGFWNELPQHRDAIGLLEQALAERIERNAREWNLAERTEKSLRATLNSLARSDKQRPQLEQQLARLRNGIAPPDRLADREEVRNQLLELIAHRNALWLAAQAIRHMTAQLPDLYSTLQQDEQVQATLRRTGANHRLGPARDYRDELKKLPEFERLALTPWVPLVLVGQRQRVCFIANETTPITFTWTSSPEPTLITAAMAEAIGLQTRRGVAEEIVSIDKQTWRAKSATLPYLRIGKFEIREVKVLILPPEAEAAGARIGPAAFEGYRVEPQPSRLRLVVSPLEPAAP